MAPHARFDCDSALKDSAASGDGDELRGLGLVGWTALKDTGQLQGLKRLRSQIDLDAAKLEPEPNRQKTQCQSD